MQATAREPRSSKRRPAARRADVRASRLATHPRPRAEHPLSEVGVKHDTDKKAIVVTRSNDERQSRALHGLTRSLIQNMVKGVVDVYEKKLEFQRIYNGACTRLGEKEINASINTFIDQIKGNGELAKAHEKWMKLPLPTSFPETMEGVTFVAG